MNRLDSTVDGALARAVVSALIASLASKSTCFRSAWDSLEQHKREKAFRDGITNLANSLEAQRQTLLALIDGDQFEAQFFPDLIELRGKVDELKQGLADGLRRREEFRHWRERGEAIDVAFREVDGR